MSLSDLLTEEFFALGLDGETAMFDGLKIPCQIVFPPIKSPCSNCVQDIIGRKSRNSYVAGGPIPFSHGLCPLCNGEGFVETEHRENIDVQIGWEPKGFVEALKQRAFVDIGKTFIQIKAKMTDLPKLMGALILEANKPLEAYIKFKFKRASEPIPSGMKQSKYCFILYERVGG